MCELCGKAKGIQGYDSLVSGMLEEDKGRLEYSKRMAGQFSTVSKMIYSSMKWPVKLLYPMFEARAAYAVPNNYFQRMALGDERLGNSFAHGAMRSVFFAGDKLVVFTKSVHFHDGEEFFTSFILLHLQKDEYEAAMAGNEIRISADVEKPMKNLITGKVEKRRVSFNFLNKSVEGRIVSKEHVVRSARFKQVYGKYGGAQVKSASMDLEGYAITVPHFSPHPYMLQLSKEFGFDDNKQFQLHAVDYFREHLR